MSHNIEQRIASHPSDLPIQSTRWTGQVVLFSGLVSWPKQCWEQLTQSLQRMTEGKVFVCVIHIIESYVLCLFYCLCYIKYD